MKLKLAFLLVVVAMRLMAYWEDKSGDVTVSSAVGITESDKPTAAVTKINLSYGSTLWVTNLTTKWEMTTPISGSGKIRVKSCSDNLIINADNRDYTGWPSGQPGYWAVEDAATTVIVSNRYGLGSSTSKKAASLYSGTSFKFGGNGLTNDVAITGTYEFAPQWAAEEGTFVQNNSLDCNSFAFRNAEITCGTFGSGNTTYIKVAPGCSLTVGTNVFVRASTGATGAALGFGAAEVSDATYYWGTSSTNTYRYATIYGSNTKIVCIGKNAISCGRSIPVNMGYLNAHNLVIKPELDMNGYDQSVPWISTYGYSSDNTRLAVKSDGPATMTFYCLDASAHTGDLLFQGAASFTYAGVAGSTYTMGYSSTSTGKLAVTSGTLELKTGVKWAGREIEASGSGTLKLNTTVQFPYAEDGKTASRLSISGDAKVDIANGATIEVGALRCGNQAMAKGLYGSQAAYGADLIDQAHVLAQLSGTGTLRVLTSGVKGLMVLCR